MRALVQDTARKAFFLIGSRGILPRSARNRSCGTRHAASATMRRDIFEPPATRSLKMIGTSTIVKPSSVRRYVISIWKA